MCAIFKDRIHHKMRDVCATHQEGLSTQLVDIALGLLADCWRL